MTLKQAENHIGRKVVYKPFLGCDMDDWEYGVITSVNSKYVFVRYGSAVSAKATDPNDLELEV